MAHDVRLWGSIRPLADNLEIVEVEAATIGELLQKLVEAHPGLAPVARDGIAVSINGVLYQHSHNQPIPDGADVYLLPQLKGG